MKVVILAGGYGTRLSEETAERPKPMIEIGGKPLLWHIMKIYTAHGLTDFIICAGYRGYVIKEYFANYFLHSSNVTFDLRTNKRVIHQNSAEPWTVTIVDTGEDTMTGGRLKRIGGFLDGADFCFTYGDGLADVDITTEIAFHRAHGGLATMTAVRPPGRFGNLTLDGDAIVGFEEKPKGDGNWINGGFFVLSPRVLDYIDGDDAPWELRPLESLSGEGQLHAYRHRGFWQPMDTLRDKRQLESHWESGKAPWKVWS